MAAGQMQRRSARASAIGCRIRKDERRWLKNTNHLTDGRRSTRHRKLKPNGQQQDYVVLAEEERAKGFVRPCGGPTSI